MEIRDSSTVSMQFETLSGETVTAEKQSNQTSTINLSVLFTKVLSSSKAYVLDDETVEITTTLTNESEIDITAISYKAVLDSAVEFVAGSVVVNDVAQPESDIVTGIELDDMSTEATNVVKFNIRAILPSSEEFSALYGVVNYTITDPIEGEKELEENTNQLDLEIITADITIVNSVDKGYAIKGDTLHYTTLITNGESSEKTNLEFTNPIPQGTVFVSGSVLVDDVEQADYNPETGFALSDLTTGGTAKIEFDVTVE